VLVEGSGAIPSKNKGLSLGRRVVWWARPSCCLALAQHPKGCHGRAVVLNDPAQQMIDFPGGQTVLSCYSRARWGLLPPHEMSTLRADNGHMRAVTEGALVDGAAADGAADGALPAVAVVVGEIVGDGPAVAVAAVESAG
jgi:hypothetical protein